jgi:hypothetical protein
MDRGNDFPMPGFSKQPAEARAGRTNLPLKEFKALNKAAA